MKLRSLKHKLLVCVVLALTLVVALLSWQSYSTQKTQLLQASQQELKRIGDMQAQRVTEWLAIRTNVVSSLQEYISDDFVPALQQARAAGKLESVYFGGSDGKMQDADPSVDNSHYDPRSRPWYQDAMAKGRAIITKPYIDSGYGIQVVSLAQPTAKGVIGGDLGIDTLVAEVNRMAIPAAGFAIMMHNDGTVIAYKDGSKAMRPVAEIDDDLGAGILANIQKTAQLQSLYFDADGRDKLVWATAIPDTDWQLLLLLDKATLEAPLGKLLWTQVGLAALVLLVSTAAISWFLGLLLAPLGRVSQALARIADGNGDLTQRITVDSNDEVAELADNFNRFVSAQHQLISHIRQLAAELDLDAERGLNTTQSSVVELQRQQQEVTMVATAVTEMASATQEIAANAELTATAAQQSSCSSQQGKSLVLQTRNSIHSLAEEVGQTTEVINELNRHAQAISGILTAIQGVAEQTNLLALNAAIEAARAGEQGRGFAVVADEVRVLSQRTQDSASEIHDTIEALQQTTARAVASMENSRQMAGRSVGDAEEASKALEEIAVAVAQISDMAGQIATAAEEQTQVTGEITQNTTAIKDVTDEITATAMDDLEHAKALKVRATDLNAKVATFVL